LKLGAVASPSNPSYLGGEIRALWFEVIPEKKVNKSLFKEQARYGAHACKSSFSGSIGPSWPEQKCARPYLKNT
jgi:hypothetical protein